jgi:hypothetical protein
MRAMSTRARPLCLVALLLAACDPSRAPDAPVSAVPTSTPTHASTTAPPTPSGSAPRPVADAPSMQKRPCVHEGKLGRDLEVGPGQKLTTLSDVPWETLGPGDTVRVHFKPEPYRDKILISQSGSAEAPIRLCGIAGPNGERPILDGDGAATRRTPTYAYEPQQDRGLVIVSLDAADRYGYKPSHIEIEGLEIRNAHPDHGYTGAAGDKRQFMAMAAGIFIERGEDITVRDCVIHDNGNGFFVASGDDEARLSRRITFEGNDVFGNGTPGKGFDRRHNIYGEAVGMTYQWNHIGPLREGAGGSALKDRSAGTIVRYNWIEGGARQLDLVEAEDGWPMMKDLPEYRDAFVYGNVIVSRAGATNVVHFGGDNGLEDKYRLGTLYFYANTVVAVADETKRWRVAVLELSTNRQTADVRDNVFWTAPSTPGSNPSHLTVMAQFGTAVLGKNVAGPAIGAFSDAAETKGKIDGLERIIKVTEPPFVDVAKLELRPRADSPSVGAFEPLSPKALPLTLEYVPHKGSRVRTPHDLGALEH